MSPSSQPSDVPAPRDPLATPRRELFHKPEGVSTRWSTAENPNGVKGAGARTNRGGKGRAFVTVESGESATLLDIEGAGLVTRFWFTHDCQKPEELRSLRLDIYWDGASTPAVSVPFGDFFCALFGKTSVFENELFANPEGRSFNSYIPMPFRRGARIVVTNENPRRMHYLFYEVNYLLVENHAPDTLYFHAVWRRENPTALGRDFEILPTVRGAGRFLGANIGLRRNPADLGWWGEGETKVYLDGDDEHPTLVGTGTEDFIGTAWGMNKFCNRYQGCLIFDEPNRFYGFYRYHIPDPIYFDTDIRVAFQQLGGSFKGFVQQKLDEGHPILPVSINWTAPEEPRDAMIHLLSGPEPLNLKAVDAKHDTWVNFYRQDDVCATALFYLDRPENGLPPLVERAARIENLEPDVKTEKAAPPPPDDQPIRQD